MPITKATASSIAPAAKGDLVVGSATNDAAVLGVGSNDQVLTADSSTATGLKWAAASGGASSFVGCVISNTSESINYSNNTVTTIALNYEAIDTDGFHDNSTNNSRITIPSGKAGKYRISAVAFWGANTTGYRSIRILKNGSTVKEANVSPNMGNVGPSMVVTAILDLAVSDYVQFNVLQNSGGDLALYYGSGQYGWYEAEFLGA